MAEENSKSDKKSKKSAKKPPPSDEEVEVMLSRMSELRRSLEKKLDEAYGTQGLSYQQVNEYLENRANFTDMEWKQLEKRRDEVRKELEEKLAGAAPTKKKVVKKKKGPRKFRGPRKGWMKMD